MKNSKFKIKNEKGIMIVVALFLFMLLAIFALNLAQVMVVDTKTISPNPATGVTGMGPMKEFERLWTFYLAQAGLNHLRREIVADPMRTTLSLTFNDDPTAPTGYYVISLGENSTTDTPHTLLPDLIATSEGRTPSPPTSATNTRMILQEQFWRSTRAYSAIPPADYDPTHPAVKLIDQYDPLLPPTLGLDQDMGRRNASGNPPVQPPPMNLNNYWSCRNCNNGYEVVIDFGMEVVFDEIRWLNEYNAWIQTINVWYWDDANRVWVAGTSSNPSQFPRPGMGPLVPYYLLGLSCPTNPQVYNGDRCTNFRGLPIPGPGEPPWGLFEVGEDVCTASDFCKNPISMDSTLPELRSYIARYTLLSPVTTRRVRIQPHNPIAGSTLNLQELSFYCCGPTEPKTNVLQFTHGLARVAFVYDPITYPTNPITFPTPNSADTQSEGVLTKVPQSPPNLE